MFELTIMPTQPFILGELEDSKGNKLKYVKCINKTWGGCRYTFVKTIDDEKQYADMDIDDDDSTFDFDRLTNWKNWFDYYFSKNNLRYEYIEPKIYVDGKIDEIEDTSGNKFECVRFKNNGWTDEIILRKMDGEKKLYKEVHKDFDKDKLTDVGINGWKIWKDFIKHKYFR